MATFNKLDLKRFVNASKDEYVDNTDTIRQIKHSQVIADDVNTVLSTIMAADIHNKLYNSGTLPSDAPIQEFLTDENIAERCAVACPLLYKGYNDIFMRLMKKEINVGILFQVLNVLREIEDGEVDHETGSIKVGKLLYSMYVDSRVRATDNKEAEMAAADTEVKMAGLTVKELQSMAEDESRSRMTWKQYCREKSNV